MLLFGHCDEDAKLLQSHRVLLHQFDQREAEARDEQEGACTEQGRPKAFRRQFADVSFQAHRGQCNRLEECRRGDNPCLGIGGDRIGEHRDRSEDGYTRDCVGNVFVMGIGDGIGGNDGRCPPIDVPAAMSSASLGSTPSRSPIQMVETKEARTVAAIMPRPPPPIPRTWLDVNGSPSGKTAIRSSQRRLNVTPCLAQAAVPTMLWNAIPIIMDRIMGLNVAMPGSCLMANAAPAITEFRNRPGRISRVFRPGHCWIVEGTRASAPSFSDSASLVVEIKVMSWLPRR